MTTRKLADIFTVVLLGASARGTFPVDVRRAETADDLDAVVALRDAHGGSGLRSTALDSVDAGGLLLLATAQGVPVGTCRITHGGDPPALPLSSLVPRDTPYLEVGKLVVASGHRHFGVTAALGARILAEAAGHGAGRIAIDCMDHLVAYYERLGFRRVARDETFVPAANLLLIDDSGFPTLTAIQALASALAAAAATGGSA